MAHCIETMAYVGEVPWHGLGNLVEEDISLDQFRVEAGLDWEVSKRPVEYSNGTVFKDKFVLARDTDDKAYAVVSNRYKPVQPKEIFEFFRDLLSMHKMQMHTAGSLMDGGRIWALAKTGDVHKVLGNDRVDGFLLLSTSYDLKLSTLAQFTSVRVVCNNTLQQALKESSGRVTIPHMQEFKPEEIHAELGIGRQQWSAFTGALDALAKIKLDTVKATEVIGKVFKLPADITQPDPDRLHASNVIDMFQYKTAIGADLAGDTAWGLLNCVTEYVDFKKRARGQGNRINSAWFGEGASLKEEAMNELLLLAA